MIVLGSSYTAIKPLLQGGGVLKVRVSFFADRGFEIWDLMGSGLRC